MKIGNSVFPVCALQGELLNTHYNNTKDAGEWGRELKCKHSRGREGFFLKPQLFMGFIYFFNLKITAPRNAPARLFGVFNQETKLLKILIAIEFKLQHDFHPVKRTGETGR